MENDHFLENLTIISYQQSSHSPNIVDGGRDGGYGGIDILMISLLV